MPATILDGLNLLARWAHVGFAMAWLGGALYFAWRAREQPADEAAAFGEQLLRWEVYATWLAGFALLVLMYYVDAEAYLIDPGALALSRWAAIALSLAFLVGTLAAYEGLCRARLSETVLAGALLALFALAAWGLAQVFSGRGAFIHYGAILGTIMAGNVAHVTIPAHRRRLQALGEGRAPDAKDVARARQRLMHNSALVPAVVFAMISTHYPALFVHRLGWLCLVLATAAGWLARRGWRRSAR